MTFLFFYPLHIPVLAGRIFHRPYRLPAGFFSPSPPSHICIYIGNCETGLAFDVQRRQTPDFVGDEQEKVDGDTGKVGMEGKQTEKRAHE